MMSWATATPVVTMSGTATIATAAGRHDKRPRPGTPNSAPPPPNASASRSSPMAASAARVNG